MATPCLVFIGDIHDRMDLLQRALAVVPKGASLAFTGDFMNLRRPKLARASIVHPEDVLSVHAPLIEYLNAIDAPCYYVLGNHDPVALAGRLGSQWMCLDLATCKLPGTDMTLGGIGGSHMVPPELPPGAVRRFLEGIVPGAPSGKYVDRGFVEFPVTIEGKPSTVISRIPGELATYVHDPPSILLTHTPPVLPSDSDDISSMLALHFKSLGLARAIEQVKPSYVISGHLHEPKPLFHDLVHGNDLHAACMQTGALDQGIPLWMMDFSSSRSIPVPRRLDWW
ncbi:MAG: hypothetical protein GYA24_02935 [Candidatus Lokiarchaeota archaeon]|nr:hypothetical protein [Candidatus Lokiarchaeota archaeon]